MQDSELCLLRGAEILGRKLYSLGFSFEIVERGKGSGGHFVVGRFRAGDREIILWFRYELGGVSYKKGDLEASHVEYMHALGRERTANYPGFGHADELAGFRHPLQDLENCDSFLADDGNAFYSLMKNNNNNKRPTGFAALSQLDKA